MSETEKELKESKDDSRATETNSPGNSQEPSIEEDYEKAKKDYKDANDIIDQKSKERDDLKTDITYLEKSIGEVNQTVESCNKAYQNIEKEVNVFDEYVVSIKKMILSVIPDGEKKQVEDKRDAIDRKKGDQETKVQKLWGDYDTARTNFGMAQDELNQKQAAYDDLKKYQTNIENKIKNLKSLRDLIEKADIEKEVDRKKMYFWTLELEKKFSAEPKLKKCDQLKAELESKLKELNVAKGKIRTAEDNMRLLKNNYETEKRVLESLITNRNKDILNEISSKEGQ